ncbi:MAG: hypothetical protein JXQ96_14895 [Cyclobacteriaceae bacterium]
MNYDLWKSVARKDIAFRSILNDLVCYHRIDKERTANSLNISARYELIRMESYGMIKFATEAIELGESADLLLSFFRQDQLKTAV